MKMVNGQVIKLGVGTGLVVGMVSMLVLALIKVDFDWMMWQWLKELAGLSLGITYIVLQWRELRQQFVWTTVVEKYTLYVYWTVLAALGWYLLLWVLDAWKSFETVEIGRLVGIAGNQTTGAWISWVIGIVLEAVRLVGWGLVVVIGWWKLARDKRQET